MSGASALADWNTSDTGAPAFTHSIVTKARLGTPASTLEASNSEAPEEVVEIIQFFVGTRVAVGQSINADASAILPILAYR